MAMESEGTLNQARRLKRKKEKPNQASKNREEKKEPNQVTMAMRREKEGIEQTLQRTQKLLANARQFFRR
jgi:hypothetical protein